MLLVAVAFTAAVAVVVAFTTTVAVILTVSLNNCPAI